MLLRSASSALASTQAPGCLAQDIAGASALVNKPQPFHRMCLLWPAWYVYTSSSQLATAAYIPTALRCCRLCRYTYCKQMASIHMPALVRLQPRPNLTAAMLFEKLGVEQPFQRVQNLRAREALCGEQTWVQYGCWLPGPCHLSVLS